MKRFFGFYKNRYDEKKFGRKKFFGPPSQRKQGPETKKNTLKWPILGIKGQNMTEKMSYSNFS